jgi:hypothetical protein
MTMELNIKLTRNEAGQLIDALESRCEAYRKTAEYFRGENDGCDFLIEDVTDEEEAENLYEMYRSLIEKIRGQLS